MEINLIKHKIKNFFIFLHLYKEKEKFFTKDIFKSKKYNIGDYTYGEPIVFFSDEANLTIGKFCSIAQNVKIFLGGNHRMDWVSTYPFNALIDKFPTAKSIQGHPATKGDVIIGNDVWIGYGTTIMSGLTIENGAVIAAYSVITKNIGAYEVWGGNPARFIKKRFNEVSINYLQTLEWWNWELSDIINNVNIICSPNIEKLTMHKER